MEKPKICTLRQAHGGVAERRETLDSATPIDLSLDGVKDEYFTVTTKTQVICGEVPADELADKLIKDLTPPSGDADAALENPKRNGNTIIGRNWRVDFSIGNGVTVIKIVEAAAAANPTGKNKLKHLGNKELRWGDPVKVGNDSPLFVLEVDYSRAIRWDGKNMTVDYDRIKVVAATKAGLEAMRSGKRAEKGDIRVFSINEIKEVFDRSKFPEFYENKGT